MFVTEIPPLNKEIYEGENYELPSTINAKLSDGTDEIVSVDWEENMPDKTGNYDLKGIIRKYNKEVSFFLNILPIKNKDVLVYKLPKALGMPKLTKEEASELIGKDIDTLKDKINTVYDMLQFLSASNFTEDERGDVKVNSGDITWHYNRPADVVLKDNKGNCGGNANLVNYLLQGDYDELGYIVYSATDGGHVFNYIKQDGKYYIFDLVQYAMFNFKRYNYKIEEVSDLKDYGPICRASYKKDIKLIVSYTADTQLANGNTRGRTSPEVMMYFPTNSKINTIYDTPTESITVKYKDAPGSVPNWN